MQSKMADLDVTQFFLGLIVKPPVCRNRKTDFGSVGILNMNMPILISRANAYREIKNLVHPSNLK